MCIINGSDNNANLKTNFNKNSKDNIYDDPYTDDDYDDDCDDYDNIYKHKFTEFDRRLRQLNCNLDRLNNIQGSIQSIGISENFKNFYERNVKPALDIVTLISTSARSTVEVADIYNRNIYANKKDVKRALKITDHMLDELEVGLALFDWELRGLLKESGMPDCDRFI
ncbi:hypothetical protein [Clostridium mediterraneense]|uniref:hypothetical protein n=1 Tax=Clostridium mediterraneense TaxID=1805472 RepID=UPI00082F1483|nr:hypothetical protein [Clostridium mediterraneense]